jgi:type II secretory pathway pseudopilin PulG
MDSLPPVAMGKQTARRVLARGAKRRAGTSLVEVMIAAIVLTVAVAGASGSMLSAMVLQRSQSESALARQAARRVLEELQGRPFTEVFRAYNRSVSDDAGLAKAASGANFAVAGLTPQAGDADGQCGQVIFPSVLNPDGTEDLDELSGDASLGMPYDLDNDTNWEMLTAADPYTVLPVRVRVEWRGLAGPQHYDLDTILSQR